MAFDEHVARRIRFQLAGKAAVTERKMFGCVAFMILGHMVDGIAGSSLMARVGPIVDEQAQAMPHVSAQVFGEDPAKGCVRVLADGLMTETQLRGWLELCCTFVDSLPEKKAETAGEIQKSREIRCGHRTRQQIFRMVDCGRNCRVLVYRAGSSRRAR